MNITNCKEQEKTKSKAQNSDDPGYDLLKYLFNFFTETHKKILHNDERVDLYRKIEQEFVISNFYYLYSFYNHEKIYEKDKKTVPEMYLDQYIKETSLFHYTTFDALENILTAKRFKLSCLSEMNDPTEGCILLDYLKNNENGDIIDEFIEIEKKEFRNIYTMSFSLSKDDAAQWERYAKKKGCKIGVCIEIKLFELFKFLRSNYDTFNIYPVYYYVKDEIKKENRDLDLMIYNAYKNMGKKDGIKELAVASAFFKNYSFRYEHEIRFTIKYDSNNELCKRTITKNSENAIFFSLKDFFNTQVDGENKGFSLSNLITAIYLEPQYFDENCAKLKEILKEEEEKNRQTISILKSACPLAI